MVHVWFLTVIIVRSYVCWGCKHARLVRADNTVTVIIVRSYVLEYMMMTWRKELSDK
jgi:hypothetical protein